MSGKKNNRDVFLFLYLTESVEHFCVHIYLLVDSFENLVECPGQKSNNRHPKLPYKFLDNIVCLFHHDSLFVFEAFCTILQPDKHLFFNSIQDPCGDYNFLPEFFVLDLVVDLGRTVG